MRCGPTGVSRWIGLAAGLVALSGCAATTPHEGPLKMAETAIAHAERNDAPTLATDELERAKSKLAQARRAVEAEDYARAKRLAEQAELDAELADLKARTARTRQTLAEVRASVDALIDALRDERSHERAE